MSHSVVGQFDLAFLAVVFVVNVVFHLGRQLGAPVVQFDLSLLSIRRRSTDHQWSSRIVDQQTIGLIHQDVMRATLNEL